MRGLRLTALARLGGPGGLKTVLAETLFIKLQFPAIYRFRHRVPIVTR
ncbi:MAG: hypothetical protein ACYDDO_04300 [Acidiferrobacterales bacterium]